MSATNDRIAALMEQLARELRGAPETSTNSIPFLREAEAQCASAHEREKEKEEMIAPPVAPPPVLMTRPEVAELLRIDIRTLHRIRADPNARFPRPIQIGSAIRWRRNSIERWIASRAS